MAGEATSTAAPATGADTHRFPALDGYRAVAAVAVVIFHVLAHMFVHDQPGELSAYTGRLGRFGVTIFFLLSGFLLYRRYALSQFERRSPTPVREFYWNRGLRIVPAYWLVLTVGVVILGLWPAIGVKDHLLFYGFAQIYPTGYHHRGLPVAWTLAVEASWYLALPAMAWAIRRLSAQTRGVVANFQMQLIAIGVLYFASLGYRWLVLDVQGLFSPRLLYLPAFLDHFALGMLLALISAWTAQGRRLPRAFSFLAAHPWVALVFSAQFFWMSAQLNIPRTGAYPPNFSQTFLLSLCLTWSAFFLLIPGVFGRDGEGLWRRAMQSSVAGFFGRISYGIYLWHLVVLEVIEPKNIAFNWPRFIWLFTITMVFTTALAWLSYRFVEKPIMRLKFPTRFSSNVADNQ